MTQQPPGPTEAPPGPPRPGAEDLRDLSRLRRTVGPHRKVAGVAGGLARHLDIDPLVLRVALVVLAFFGGAGIIVYAAVWLLVPEDGDQRAPFHFDDRTRSVALVIAGVIAGLALLGDSMGGFGFPWPLAIVALAVLAVVAWNDRDKPRPTAPPVPHVPAAGPPPPGPPPPGTPSGPSWSTPAAQRGWVGETDPTRDHPTYAAGLTPDYPAYDVPTAPATTVPPTPPATSWQPVRQDWRPRKRGPKLFWFTLALSALAVGVLGILDAAGVGVADSAYPATVLAICGAMLLLGAFYGRPGGIIVLGLVAALGTAGATVSDQWDGEQQVRAPLSAAAVQDRYEIGAGELVLDLTRVSDLEALDGRTLEVRGGAASLEVIVPADLDVDVEARAGLGDVEVFDDEQDGGGVDLTGSHDGGIGVPRIDLQVEVGLGEIRVHVEDADVDDITNGATR